MRYSSHSALHTQTGTSSSIVSHVTIMCLSHVSLCKCMAASLYIYKYTITGTHVTVMCLSHASLCKCMVFIQVMFLHNYWYSCDSHVPLM